MSARNGESPIAPPASCKPSLTAPQGAGAQQAAPSAPRLGDPRPWHGAIKPVVPVSAIAALVENRELAFATYYRLQRAPPTDASVSGDFEHRVRHQLIDALRPLYVGAKGSDELRQAQFIISDTVDSVRIEIERSHPFLSLDLERFQSGLLNRLRIEEDARVAAADNLLRAGHVGLDLVAALLP